MTPKQREAMQEALETLDIFMQQYPHMTKGYMLDARGALIKALAEPDTPDGWKLVPIEPIEKMIDEGAQGMASFDVGTSWPESFDKLQVKRMCMDAKKAWRYMIAAAPEHKE